MENNISYIDSIIKLILIELNKISLTSNYNFIYKYNTIIKKLMAKIILSDDEINIINFLLYNSDLLEEEKIIISKLLQNHNYVIKNQLQGYNDLNKDNNRK